MSLRLGNCATANVDILNDDEEEETDDDVDRQAAATSLDDQPSVLWKDVEKRERAKRAADPGSRRGDTKRWSKRDVLFREVELDCLSNRIALVVVVIFAADGNG